MRKFHVSFLNECWDAVTTTVGLGLGEKANAVTFQSKINKMYDTRQGIDYCNEVLSWSLIEE